MTWLPESIDSWFGLDQVLQGCFKVWKLPISFEYCCIAQPLIWCLLSCSTTVQAPPRPIKGSCEHCEHSLNETFMCQERANYCPFIPFAQWFLPARGGTAWVAGVRKVGSSSTHLGVRGDPSLTDQFIKRICEGLPWNEAAKDTWGERAVSKLHKMLRNHRTVMYCTLKLMAPIVKTCSTEESPRYGSTRWRFAYFFYSWSSTGAS